MGSMACKQLINYLDGKEYQSRSIMDFEILVRKSTSKL